MVLAVEVEVGVEDEEEEHLEISGDFLEISGEDSGLLRPTLWRNQKNSRES